MHVTGLVGKGFPARGLAGVLALLLTTGCTVTGTIQSRVVDAETGQPIAGAVALAAWWTTEGMPGLSYTKLVGAQEAETNAQGRFTLERPAGGIYLGLESITVYKLGYVVWNNREIFPTYQRRESTQAPPEIRLDTFPLGGNHRKHRDFISHVTGLARERETSLLDKPLKREGELARFQEAFGQATPEGFGALKWGATQEQVKRALPRTFCDPSRSELADWACSWHEDVSGARVGVTLKGYTTGKAIGLATVSLSFEPDDLRRIVEAFDTVYGPPSRVEEKDYLFTRDGRRISTSAEWVWEFPDSTINIGRHLGRFEAMAIVSRRAAQEEFRERMEQRKVR